MLASEALLCSKMFRVWTRKDYSIVPDLQSHKIPVRFALNLAAHFFAHASSRGSAEACVSKCVQSKAGLLRDYISKVRHFAHAV
jgi:hypothetical protein